MTKQKTLFYYYDPHYFHAALAKAIGCDNFAAPKIRSSENDPVQVLKDVSASTRAIFSIPKNYEVYLCEATYIFPAIARNLGIIRKDSKIMNITSNPLLYYMKTGRVDGARKMLGASLLKEVDGFICVGKMEENLVKWFFPQARTIVTYPFIKRDTKKAILEAGKPNLGSKTILCIGSKDPYTKGIDLLIEAYRTAKKTIPDLKLTILGDYDKIISEEGNSGITCPGYVADTSRYINGAALYVHLGRGEAFGISIMEAMLGGVPAIVSEATGAKELVSKIDKNMVVPLNARKAAEAIVKYFNISVKERNALSARCKTLITEYDEKSILLSFKKDYHKLVLSTFNDKKHQRRSNTDP